ncbi:MAG: NAD(P)H-binding protein [Nitriliruptorales bacterium]|nr:NAD(P)H-binding protein [Nitriliruptorales bacterium]
MKVLVAGSHGKIGRRLVSRLAADGHKAIAMIRDPSQAEELRVRGGQPLVADLAQDVAFAVEGCDAIVYTAGAGAGSGAAKKQTVDRAGAEKLVDAARRHGVRRYVMVSSIGAHDPGSARGPMRPYLEAKQQADKYLAASGLDYTIVRPGRLTDDGGDGRIEASLELGRRGDVPRDDVATTLLAVLSDDRTIGLTFELFDGATPIADALDRLVKTAGRP